MHTFVTEWMQKVREATEEFREFKGASVGCQGKWLIGKQLLALNEHSPSDAKSMLPSTMAYSHSKQSKAKQNSLVYHLCYAPGVEKELFQLS